MSLLKLKRELLKNAQPNKAEMLGKFFKTGEGEYGEGDIFLGIYVPTQREIAKKYDLDLKDIQKLLDSNIHDERLVGLFILINKYKKGVYQKEIFNFYLKNAKRVNNWDLVDLSAPNIVGNFLVDKEDRKILYKLAESTNLWEKRIAMLSTFSFIKDNQFEDTFNIAEILLKDDHDLIHKAVGWMLREVGKRNQKLEERFLKKYYKKMPRTMLRYAIEKFPEGLRQSYLKDRI